MRLSSPRDADSIPSRPISRQLGERANPQTHHRLRRHGLRRLAVPARPAYRAGNAGKRHRQGDRPASPRAGQRADRRRRSRPGPSRRLSHRLGVAAGSASPCAQRQPAARRRRARRGRSARRFPRHQPRPAEALSLRDSRRAGPRRFRPAFRLALHPRPARRRGHAAGRRRLVGHPRFQQFRDAGAPRATSVRTVFDLRVQRGRAGRCRPTKMGLSIAASRD